MIQGEKKKLDFRVQLFSPTFDNDDNPYGKFVFHMYTNMKDLNDTAKVDEDEHAQLLHTFEDRVIPIKPCGEELNVAWRESSIKQYCPVYNETKHFLYGNFYTQKYSWMRLAMHFCDSSEEARQERIQAGKKHIECKTKNESIEYF